MSRDPRMAITIVVSKEHLTSDTHQWLNGRAGPPESFERDMPVKMRNDEGWLLWVPDEPHDNWLEQDDPWPEDVLCLLAYAGHVGADLVLLDGPMIEIEGLPLYRYEDEPDEWPTASVDELRQAYLEADHAFNELAAMTAGDMARFAPLNPERTPALAQLHRMVRTASMVWNQSRHWSETGRRPGLSSLRQAAR